MRNTIQYYYGIEVDDITYQNNKYYFDDYVLAQIYKDIDMNIYSYVSKIGISNYEIIPNKNNEYVTIIDNKKYILLKKSSNRHSLNFSNLEKNNIFIKSNELIPWDTLWENKIDYYEKHVKTLSSLKIKDTFHYYVGLSENAISLYKTIKQEDNVYLSHIRLSNDEDYLNPINFIVDYRVRDIAEYTKKLFFMRKLNLNDLFLYFRRNNFSVHEYLLFYVRLLYPSYYFDAYDLVAQGEDDSILDNYILRINSYEIFLKDVYLYLKQYVDIPRIDWLINKKVLSNDKTIIHQNL